MRAVLVVLLLCMADCGAAEEEVPWTCDTRAATCNGFYDNYIKNSVCVYSSDVYDAIKKCEIELGRRFSGMSMCIRECPYCEATDQCP